MAHAPGVYCHCEKYESSCSNGQAIGRSYYRRTIGPLTITKIGSAAKQVCLRATSLMVYCRNTRPEAGVVIRLRGLNVGLSAIMIEGE